MTSFEGKTIVITGAASGIGLAVAKLLASRRAQLSLADMNTAGLEAALKSLPGGGHIITQVDVRNSQQVNAWIEKTVSVFGKLDGAVNMAGVFTHGTCLRDETDDTWDFIMGVNARGVFNCLRAELNHIKTGGSIVSAASVDGQAGFANASVYCASKHAVIGMSRSAAKENENVRINGVAPGSVRTPMMEGEGMAEAVEAEVAQQVQKRPAESMKLQMLLPFSSVMKLVSSLELFTTSMEVGSVAETWGPTYSSIFSHRLQAVNKTLGSDKVLQISAFDVIKDEHPDPNDFDAFLITGSIKGVYDEDPWIARLKTFIQEVYQNHQHVRLFGACFGHQIISEALLERYGVIVEKDPKGYEVGIHKVALNPKFRAHFSHILSLPEGDGLRIQFAHGDHVRFEAPWPESWMSIGSTPHCAVQGIFQPGRVLTFQGHFEFTEEISTETIKYFYTPERGFTPEQTQAALDQIRGKDDSEEAAKISNVFSMPLFKNFRSGAKVVDQAVNLDPHTWTLPSSYKPSQADGKQTIIPDPRVFSNVFSIPCETEAQSIETLLAYPDASHAAVHLALLECFRNLKASAGALNIEVIQPPSYDDTKSPVPASPSEPTQLPSSQKWDLLIKLAVTRFTTWWSGIELLLNHASAYSHHGGSRAALQLTKDYLPPLDILLVWYALMLSPEAYEAACNAQGANAMRLKNLCFPWPAIRDVIDMDKMQLVLPRSSQKLFTNITSQPCDILEYLQSPPAYADTGKVRIETDLFSEVKRHEDIIEESNKLLWIRSPALQGSLIRAGLEYLDFHLREPNAVEEDMVCNQSFGVRLFWRTHRLFPRQYKAFLKEIGGIQSEGTQGQDLKRDAKILFDMDDPSPIQERCHCWTCERIRDDLPEFVYTKPSTAASSSTSLSPTQKQISSLPAETLLQIQDDLGFCLTVEDARRSGLPLPTRPPTAAEKEANMIAKQKQKELGYRPGLNEYVEVLPDGRRKIRTYKYKYATGMWGMTLF
ncbi:hypothetical protein FPHYL_1628 [Fusarium phyllophilum]|uniref:Ketoreductase domain-containing protein n=1 Tax=Fusarium phyllophilum TaxID=47803 RepID=A0A8H5KAT1_9HYPO|nr:hypothetical protein FPHYL_1628 [Fusarium phyllophilum]